MSEPEVSSSGGGNGDGDSGRLGGDVVDSCPQRAGRLSRRGGGMSRWGAAVLGAAALALGAVGVAAAADSSPTPSPSGSAEINPDERAGADERGQRMKRLHGGGFGGPGGPGMRGAIRGEWVVPDGEGGYRTMASQRGEVTSVSSDRIVIRSEDGTSREYAVDDDTLVNSRRGGITDVEEGTQAQVMALKTGSTYTAVQVIDVEATRGAHERFGGPRMGKPGREMPAPPPPGSSTAPSGTISLGAEEFATA